MNEWTTDPKEILETYARDALQSPHILIYGNYVLVIPKQLREHIQDAGWTKTDIAEFVFERARVKRGEWASVGKGSWCATVPVRCIQPCSRQTICCSSAGGPAGGFGPSSHLDGQQDEGRDGRNRRLRRL
jgi:hypothetical protein